MAGYIVGTIAAIITIIIGIYGLSVSKRKGEKNKWAPWLIIFGCCAIVSAFINYSIK
ncbi:UNVERIFIED_CONTAM: Mg2+ and Co2+ transporter CorA [Paenibacillus sp. PvR008]